MRPHFRFEDLEIWQLSKVMAIKFHKLSKPLDKKRYYRYAEQLCTAGLSVSNNIAEGSASPHPKEFMQFLNIARRSLFEDASMLLVFEEMGVIEGDSVNDLLKNCDKLSRMITKFANSKR